MKHTLRSLSSLVDRVQNPVEGQHPSVRNCPGVRLGLTLSITDCRMIRISPVFDLQRLIGLVLLGTARQGQRSAGRDGVGTRITRTSTYKSIVSRTAKLLSIRDTCLMDDAGGSISTMRSHQNKAAKLAIKSSWHNLLNSSRKTHSFFFQHCITTDEHRASNNSHRSPTV